MFENLGAHRPCVRNVHFRLPSMAQRHSALKAPYSPIANLLYRDGSGSDLKKTFSVLQFLNTQLEIMTNVASLKSNQINSFSVEAHVLNVRAFMIELQFRSVGL